MLLCSDVFAQGIFKIITLQHRMAQDILPMISTLVGNHGVATGIDNQLIIRTDAERMLEIEQAVAVFDQVKRNFSITVSHDQSIQESQQRIDAQGDVKIGNIIVSNRNNRYSTNSAQVIVDHKNKRLKRNGQQFITVLDGQTAFISVGQLIPYTQDWVFLTQYYVSTVQTTEYVSINTGFVVRPTVLTNGQIELEITPRFARSHGIGNIDFETLKTIIRIDIGTWLDLGATMGAQDEVSRKILAVEKSRTQNDAHLSIKVE